MNVAMSARMHALVARDEAAFTEMSERYRRELQARCFRILGSVEDSEDAVQETFLRAWRSRGGVRDDVPVRAWLHRIAINASIDSLKRRRRLRVLAGDEASSEALERIAAPGLDPAEAVAARATVELALQVAARHLSPIQHASLFLRDLLGYSAKDAASALDTSPASVHSAVQRARAALRDQLHEQRLDWFAVS